MNIKEECSIVVSSCDAYSDAWSPFFILFFKYWPDCPFPIYLISETEKYLNNRVIMLNVGEDKEWATNLKLSLQKIKTPFVLYLQEDYLLKSRVDTVNIIKLFDYFKKEKAGCLRLYPSPGPNNKFKESLLFGEIDKKADYSISTQATIWDKNVLEDLIIDGESGWDMEIKGSKRVYNFKIPFLCVYKKAINYYCTAIKRGKWFYDAVAFCEKEGIVIDKNKRLVESKNEYFKRVLKSIPFVGRLISFLMRIIKKNRTFYKIKVVFSEYGHIMTVYLSEMIEFIKKIKKYLRPIKKFFSMEYKKTYSQTGEDIIVLSAFNAMKIKKIRYLDIGAHHPFYLSNTCLFYKKNGSGVLIEPDPYLFEYIKKKRSKDICLNIGVGIDKIKYADFYIMSARTLNTFSKINAEKMSRETRHKVESIIKVPLESVNDIIDKYFKLAPNFISLDIEGIDMEILKSFDFNKFRPEIFCIETISFTDDYTGEKEQGIIDFMISNGYFVFADTYINTIFVDKEKWDNKLVDNTKRPLTGD